MMAVVPMADDPCLGKQVRHFRLIFTDREAIGKKSRKCRSHFGVGPQVSGRLCETKPEAKNPIYIGWGEEMEMYQDDKNGSLQGKQNPLCPANSSYFCCPAN